MQTFRFTLPDTGNLPTPSQNACLSQLVAALSVQNIIQLFASLLLERRIMVALCDVVCLCDNVQFTSKSLTVLTAAVHGSQLMLYPLYWQHIFIPIMPQHLLDYCRSVCRCAVFYDRPPLLWAHARSAPIPFLIGVHRSFASVVNRMPIDEHVSVDLDNNIISSPFNDADAIPSDLVRLCVSRLCVTHCFRRKRSKTH
jgi:hypothetical protein